MIFLHSPRESIFFLDCLVVPLLSFLDSPPLSVPRLVLVVVLLSDDFSTYCGLLCDAGPLIYPVFSRFHSPCRFHLTRVSVSLSLFLLFLLAAVSGARMAPPQTPPPGALSACVFSVVDVCLYFCVLFSLWTEFE